MAAFVRGPVGTNGAAEPDLDWEGLRATARLALRMMDNVIEASRFPLEQIRQAVHRTRKVGLGVMGFADLLIALGIPYDSPAAEALAERLMGTIRESARHMSARLARERGPFPAYAGSRWEREGASPLRHAAPDRTRPRCCSRLGTWMSVVAGCSAGIEPLFSLAYTKQLANGERLREVNPALLEALRARALLTPDRLAAIA